MSIFRKPEEVPPVQVEGEEVVIPSQDDQPQPKQERKILPKLKWYQR